ncbi:MAG: DegV family protein [Anaerolineaceae bacterium]|nr:DegV family protein [Anaerolineaceae bacterium]
MSHKVALITDSTCDIPAEWIRKHEITVVPLTIVFGDQQYLDGVDLTAEAFYERLGKGGPHPSTSQPTPKAFLEAYRQAAARGAQEILTITISSAMSGTMESARQAAQDFELPVHVMDGKNNSMGLGWQVMAAARARDLQGCTLEGMTQAAEQVQKNMVFYIALDTIEYLSKGGRISEAAKFLDAFIHIKPLIYVRPETGTVGASIPARTRNASLSGLYREFFRRIDGARRMHIAVLHNAALPEAEALAERIRSKYAPAELFISIVSPVLGVHTGPRAVALCGYCEG